MIGEEAILIIEARRYQIPIAGNAIVKQQLVKEHLNLRLITYNQYI